MKTIEVLILDDNFVIASKVKTKLFDASDNYKSDFDVEIFPHYLEVNNHDSIAAANSVNEYLNKYEIHYLLLDRGFGHIIDSSKTAVGDGDTSSLYKDNDVSGYYIETLLASLRSIKNNGLSKIKGVIVYTYDNYLDEGKEGDQVKNEVIYKMKEVLPKNCKIDVLLTYSDIYKIAEIDVYEGYTGKGLVRIGQKKDFILYGMFVGELLYHKLIQMINVKKYNSLREEQGRQFYRLVILYFILISINIGVTSICSYLANGNYVLIGLISLLFGLIFPLTILWLKPSILIEIDKLED